MNIKYINVGLQKEQIIEKYNNLLNKVADKWYYDYENLRQNVKTYKLAFIVNLICLIININTVADSIVNKVSITSIIGGVVIVSNIYIIVKSIRLFAKQKETKACLTEATRNISAISDDLQTLELLDLIKMDTLNLIQIRGKLAVLVLLQNKCEAINIENNEVLFEIGNAVVKSEDVYLHDVSEYNAITINDTGVFIGNQANVNTSNVTTQEVNIPVNIVIAN